MPDDRLIPVMRETVVEVTDQVLGTFDFYARYDFYEPLVGELREIARTAKYLAADWWEPTTFGKCGCLIGTYRMNHGLDPYPVDLGTAQPDTQLQSKLGIRFLEEMSERVPEFGGARAVLKILDRVD